MLIRSGAVTCKDYSLMLGLHRNTLNVYRQKRGIPKKTSPLKIYQSYRDEKQMEDNLAIELQNAYYDLLENKQLKTFGIYLKSKDIILNKNSIYNFFNRCFSSHKSILGKYYTGKRKKVLETYKEFKNEHELL